MDIIIESVNAYGHVFRTRLPKQATTLKTMKVCGSLERLEHRNIRTMNADGHTLSIAA